VRRCFSCTVASTASMRSAPRSNGHIERSLEALIGFD
jgi:hypothetical protein